MKELLQEIEQGKNIRQNLSKLRQEIKDASGLKAFQEEIADKKEMYLGFLKAEDAKTRKNAALLLGGLQDDSYLEPLYQAYEAEQQMFVKSAYLTAMSRLDCGIYLTQFQERMKELETTKVTEDNRKHIDEEMRELSAILQQVEGVDMHTFTGYDKESEMVLLTNRYHVDTVLEQILAIPGIEESKAKPFGAGIQMQTSQMKDILAIRTIQEMLFKVQGMKSGPVDAVKLAQKIVDSGLLAFLTERHRGETPFYFRIEYKSKLPLDKKAAFVKILSTEIERKSNRRLINAPSNYELEIRLVEKNEQEMKLFVKLMTIPEDPFYYRKEYVATSIKPVNAALLVQLAKDYMKPDAQVLDPFCGVGTMLIERQMVVKANTSYGIDIQREAIEKARRNTQSAGQIIHFINRNFFDFTHEYPFDEIFTNMPFPMGHTSQEEIRELYEAFFAHANHVLAKDGIVIMYTHNKEFVYELAPKYRFRIAKQFDVLKREDTQLMILQ